MINQAKFAAGTHQGMVRQKNEDTYRIVPNVAGVGIGIVIADGMGGHNSGEMASSIAADYSKDRLIKDLNERMSPPVLAKKMVEIIEKANVKVYLESLSDPKNAGMGTTLTLALVIKDIIIIAHIGDCRVYRANKGVFQRFTTDHTVVQELVTKGDLSEDVAKKHSSRHMLTRALGVAEYMDPDSYVYQIDRGDRILFCTDGLYGYVSEQDIQRVLDSSQNPQACVDQLISMANVNGGGDNITVIVSFF